MGIVITSLLGLAIAVLTIYLNMRKKKSGQPYSGPLAGATILGFFVMLFPGVFFNIGVGLVKGIFQIPGVIDYPTSDTPLFNPVTFVIFALGAISASVVLFKLNKDAKRNGMTLSEYVMSHQPDEPSENPLEELKDVTRETYHAKEEKRLSQHDQ